jgi:hypothetical protein
MDIREFEDEKIFELINYLKDGAILLRKARNEGADKLTKEENEKLEECIVNLAKGMGFELPFLFGGKITAWLLKRKSSLGKIIGLRDIIDNILRLTEIFGVIITREADTRLTARWVRNPDKLKEIVKISKGYALEPLMRGFLREIVGGAWENCFYPNFGDIEVDVYAEEFPINENLKKVHVGEIKKTLEKDDIGKFVKNISKLAEKLKKDRTSDKAKISTVALITLTLKNKMQREEVLKLTEEKLSKIFDETPQIQLFDRPTIENLCEEKGQIGQRYKKAIQLIEIV